MQRRVIGSQHECEMGAPTAPAAQQILSADPAGTSGFPTHVEQPRRIAGAQSRTCRATSLAGSQCPRRHASVRAQPRRDPSARSCALRLWFHFHSQPRPPWHPNLYIQGWHLCAVLRESPITNPDAATLSALSGRAKEGALWLCAAAETVEACTLDAWAGETESRISVQTGSRMSGGGSSRGDAEVIDQAADLQYGGSTFQAASEYLRALHRWEDPRRVRFARAVTEIDGYRALVTELRDLHGMPVSFSDSQTGRLIKHRLAALHWNAQSTALAQGVLLLPSTFPDYLGGRSRRALRRNVRAAAAGGITCQRLDRDAVASTFEQWTRQRSVPEKLADLYRSDALGALRVGRWYVALDACAAPVGLADVWLDTECAYLSCMVAVSHPARWLLHTHLVEDLYAAGISRLCGSTITALHLHPSLQYFQARLGYRVAHLHLSPNRRSGRLARRSRSGQRGSSTMSCHPIVARIALTAVLPGRQAISRYMRRLAS